MTWVSETPVTSRRWADPDDFSGTLADLALDSLKEIYMADESNPALDALITQGEALRKRFEGLPVEGPVQIANEAAERLMLTPEAGVWAERGIGGAESLAAIVLPLVGVEPPFEGLALRAFDFVLHAALASYKAHAAADLAKKRAQGSGI